MDGDDILTFFDSSMHPELCGPAIRVVKSLSNWLDQRGIPELILY